MSRQIFINLPVSDLEASTSFYQKLGFNKNPMFSDENASSMAWSNEIVVMLLRKDFYKRFIPGKNIADTQQESAVLLCLSMDSREEVDAFLRVAEENGGRIFESEGAEPHNEAMYGKNVEDPDGHIWELLYMDMSKFPAEQA